MKVIAFTLVLGVLFVPAAFSADCKEQSGSQIITISPSFISILGNKPIRVEGPFLSGATSVQFRFNDVTQITVNATIASDNVAICQAPFFYTNGRIQVDLLVTRTGSTVQTFTGFIYTQQPSTELTFTLTSKTQFKVVWDKANFDSGVPLDLELVELCGGVWTPRGVIKRNVMNTGTYSGQLSGNGLVVLNKVRNVYVVKLTRSSVRNPRQPRSVDDCTTNNSCNSVFSSYLYSLGEKSDEEINELCYSWYIQDPGAPKDAKHCPPTAAQADSDGNFEPVDDLALYNPGADKGYRQRNPSASGAGQRCVYKNGKLLVGPPSGGNVRSVSPNGPKGMTAHFVADLLPWYMCCALIKNQTACALYYERRPSDDGSQYNPRGSSCAYGDPHITTFDGYYYTFNGVGEFWVTKKKDNSFVMQGRTVQYITASGQKTTAAVFSAVVMQQKNCQGSVTVQLSVNGTNFQMLLDGQEVVYDTRPNQPKRTIMHNGASIIIVSPKDIRISFSAGYSFAFSQDLGVINMVTMVDVSLKGQVNALLGTYDGDQSNDFTLPNGNTVPINVSPEKIHDYGMQWQINAQESLFTYAPCKNYDSYQNKNFVPSFVAPNVDKLPAQSVAACKGNNECLFDLSVTGQLEVAMTTLVTIEKYNVIVKVNAITCERPTVPANAYTVATNYLAGSSVKLVCNTDFTIKGKDTIKCAKDSNGALSWDGSFGTCVQENKCANSNKFLQFICEQGLPKPNL